MKVYVVTTGIYSSYGIVAIYSTLEQARWMASRLQDANEVEEYELDEITSDKFPAGVTAYCVLFDDDGQMTKVYAGDVMNEDAVIRREVNPQIRGGVAVYVWARDEDHARKAAQDRRAQWLAEQAGIA